MWLMANCLCVNAKTALQQRSLLSLKRIVCHCTDSGINAAMKNFLGTAKWLAPRQFLHLFRTAQVRADSRGEENNSEIRGVWGRSWECGSYQLELQLEQGWQRPRCCLPTWNFLLEKCQDSQFSNLELSLWVFPELHCLRPTLHLSAFVLFKGCKYRKQW